MDANLVPGLDPTQLQQVTTDCGPAQEISASMLLQMVAQAIPADYVGFVYIATSAPNLAVNPERARWLWLHPTTGITYRYNATQTAWQQTALGTASVSGSVLINDTVPLSKLQVQVGTANMVVQVNAAGSGYQLVSIASAIPAKTLGVDRLNPGTEGSFLRVVSDSAVWSTVTGLDLLSIIGTNNIPVTYLQKSNTNGHVLQIAGGAIVWGTVSAPSLGVDGGTTGKILTNDGSTFSWAAFSTFPVAWSQLPVGTSGDVAYHNGATWGAQNIQAITIKRARLGPFNVPDVAGITAETPHGLTGSVIVLDGTLVCLTAHAGWLVDDVIPLALVRSKVSDNNCPAFVPLVRGANVRVFRVDEGGDILLPSFTDKKDTDAFVPENWRIYITVAMI